MTAKSRKRHLEKAQATATRSSSREKSFQEQASLRLPVVVLAGLLITTFFAYSGTLSNEFVFDDEDYVVANTHIRNGITLKSLVWAFNIGFASNWHPLTWMSHALDVQLCGLKPFGHHLTNIIFHLANVAAIFLVLHTMTRAVWRSLFAAALFALHPLRVESVAWVAERKDLLSTFFALLAVWTYVRYVRGQNVRYYCGTVVLFTLGLMSKPMIVTLPLGLLLLDFWPLKRMQRSAKAGSRPRLLEVRRKETWMVLEKLPLFMLSLGSCVLTLLAQHRAGSISTLTTVPVALRLQNAAVSYLGYLKKTIWPAALAAHYPYPKNFPSWLVVLSIATLLVLTTVAARFRRTQPYLFTGWLWFLITLTPVIGLVQVGAQSSADRYTYIPLIGLFVIFSWGIPDLVGRFTRSARSVRTARVILTGAAVAVCVALALHSASQVRVWKDGITLWRHAISVTGPNYKAEYNLGALLQERNRIDEAIPHYVAAIRVEPLFEDAHYNLARCLELRGDTEGAIKHYQKVLEIDPTDAQAHNNLGSILGRMGRHDDVIYHCSLAVKYAPKYARAHANLAFAYYFKQRYAESLREAKRCLECGGTLPAGFVEEVQCRLARETR